MLREEAKATAWDRA